MQFYHTISQLPTCRYRNFIRVIVNKMLTDFGAKKFCVAARAKTLSVRTHITAKEMESQEDRTAG
jgi:hypothetical protein